MGFIQIPLHLEKWNEEDIEKEATFDRLGISSGEEPDVEYVTKQGLVQIDSIDLVSSLSETLSLIHLRNEHVTVDMPVEDLIEIILKNG